jgi:predicted ribosome quality control (RQC) complex YloA/Tae2 family protein
MPVECLPYWSYLLDFFVVGVEKVKLYEDQIKASNGYAAISYTADLLMANLHISQPGASSVQLPDFETGEPVTVALDPLQTALTTAQKLYKRSQKLRRSEKAVAPLLANANEELSYLRQVEVSLQQLEEYGSPLDLKSLQEVQLWSLSTKLHRDFFTGSYSSSQVAYMLDAPQMEYDTL